MPGCTLSKPSRLAGLLITLTAIGIGIGTGTGRRRKAGEMLESVGLPSDFPTQVPGQLSGGQR